jgi:exopolyphosphatase / guanosine-5'-triphosphate,3'-diphosphate pyrophosphatase
MSTMRKLASIDIGTNSVKLLVASVDEDGSLEVVARDKEMIRLGHETLAMGRLSPEAIAAGVTAIDRFARVARGQGAETVLAVATCAVREATNASRFVEEARERCGVSVEVLSGEEEARLITLALRSEFPASYDPIFVIDIGGGSTELVVSRGEEILFAESLELGTVRLSEAFVKSDPISDEEYTELKEFIRERAGRAARRARRLGFQTCVGSSGTVQSLSLVQEASVQGGPVPFSGHRFLSRKDLKKWNRVFRETSSKEKLKIAGLDPRRRDIILVGGMLVWRLLKESGAEGIVTGDRGLREGAILDFLAREGVTSVPGARDVRARSVDRLMRRGNVEMLHAARVAELSLDIFDQTHALHQLTEKERELLRYAAVLHDIGCYVGFSKHQRHSYYLIAHGDLMGFSAEEVETLASIARYHRGKGPRPRHDNWKRLGPWQRQVVLKLASILRIADGLDRSHRQIVERVECKVRARKVSLTVSASSDCEPEIAAARRKGELFEETFGRRLNVRAVPASREVERRQPSLDILTAGSS